MANREQRRAAQKGAGTKFIEGLAQAAAKASENQQAKNNVDYDDDEGVPEPEDLNILPLPNYQEIVSGKWMQWCWIIADGQTVGGIKVFGILYLSDVGGGKRKGEYEVQLCLGKHHGSTEENVFHLAPGLTKEIGQALISAQNWQNIWKQHAGTYLEAEWFGPSEKPSNEERFKYDPINYPEGEKDE